jgi:hypothetical protein
MTDPLKRLLETLALITAFVFVISTPVAFTLYSLEQSVFDADLYIQALDEENVYQQLPALTAQTLAVAAQRPDNPGILSIFRNLSAEEWQTLIVQLLPPDVLRVLTADAVTQIMAYLNGERADAVLSLAILKAHMQSPEGINAVNGMFEAQPECTVEQLTAMALNQQALTLCDPPDTFLFFDLRPIIAAQINGLMSLIPEQVTIISAGSFRPGYLQNLNDLRILMRLSPLLPILCLLIIVVLVVRSWRGWLNWWGFPLLFAGFISLFLSVISAPLSSLTFQVLFAPALPPVFPADLLEMFKGLTAAIVRNALQPVLLVAGAILLVGLAMVGLGFLLRGMAQKAPLSYREF